MRADLSNGYRFGKTYDEGQLLELQIPRTHNGNFYPFILGLLRNQEAEAKEIDFKLYGIGLSREQVYKLFGDIYGQNYRSSQISRMFDYAPEEVHFWLKRKLESYYSIIYIVWGTKHTVLFISPYFSDLIADI
ncbi:MAG: transposase [Bacteroidales bacterium]